MNAAARQTATIHTLHAERKAHAKAIDSGRIFITSYYTTPERTHTTRNTRSMHMHTAVPNVVKNMQDNRNDSMWAEVWNDDTGHLVATVARSVLGDIQTTLYFDPITGRKLREQPFKKKRTGTGLGDEIVHRLDNVIQKLFMLDQHPATWVFYSNGLADINAILKSPANNDYLHAVSTLKSMIISEFIILREGQCALFMERANYVNKVSAYRFTQDEDDLKKDIVRIKTAHGLMKLKIR